MKYYAQCSAVNIHHHGDVPEWHFTEQVVGSPEEAGHSVEMEECVGGVGAVVRRGGRGGGSMCAK